MTAHPRRDLPRPRPPAPRAALLPGTAALLACAAALLLAAATPARAAVGIRYGLTDDAWLTDGPGTLQSRLDRLDALGVRIVRYSLRWDEIAAREPSDPSDPTDPAYDWHTADAVVEGLRAHRIAVILQLVGTPSWANGGRGSNWAPTASGAFADFATAAARHYPWVTRWLVWNEPNQVRWLRPTKPAVYTRRLLNPAYTAIHAVIPRAQVAGGATAPRGATAGVSPVAWLAGMRAAHAQLDAYAHNPYPLDPKRETPTTGGCSYCTTITMATLGRLERIVARDFPRARIWLTEYGYQSNPPDRLLGVAPALQARYLAEAAYVAYRMPRVDVLIHFLYADEPQAARFQSGLVTVGERQKPAYRAFRLPLAETGRRGATTSLWGQVRAPVTTGTVRLERRSGGGWHGFATVTPGPGGMFRWRGTLARGTEVRARAGSLAGAPVRIT